MNDNDNNRSFFEEFLKWFLVWNIITLLFKGIVFLFKISLFAMQQIIYLVCIGIKKIYLILKEKFINFKDNYNMKYKFEIKEKWKNIVSTFNNFKSKIKNLLIKIKLTKKKEETKQEDFPARVEKPRLALYIKKMKYNVIELFYKYELQIVVFIIIVIATVGVILAIKSLK